MKTKSMSKAVVLAAAVIAISAASSSASVWTRAWPGPTMSLGQGGKGSGTLLSAHGSVSELFGAPTPIVDGRVWWFGIGNNGVRDAPVYSRDLRTGKSRRIVLDGGKLQPPPDGRHQDVAGTIGVSNGKIVIVGRWSADPRVTPEPSDLGVVAVFDAQTGGLISQRPVPAGSIEGPNTMVAGSPLTQPVPQASPLNNIPTLQWNLVDPLTNAALPSHGAEVAGGHVLGLTATGAFGDLTRYDALVQNRTTGKPEYRISTTRALNGARASRGRAIFDLQNDGTLRTTITSTRGVRPVGVDANGHLRTLGRFQKNARSTTTLLGRTRSFVALLGRPTAKNVDRRCSGVWIVSSSGKRGRQITMPRTLSGRQGAPTSWDGRTAIWNLAANDPKAELPYGTHRIRVERALGALRLSAHDLPRCSATRG